MPKERVAAFSDGVIAILITIMVLELKAPDGSTFHALRPLVPVFLAYVLSFVYLAIYWNNHHHLLQSVERVNGRILWANMHLLFWLSLVPFATAWLGDNGAAEVPVASYGVVMVGAAVAYYVLQLALVAEQPELAEAFGQDLKGKGSVVAYVASIPLALLDRWIGVAIYVVVAFIWLVPDRRLEQRARAAPPR